jgi:ribonuclease P/MRP protein subunit POP5
MMRHKALPPTLRKRRRYVKFQVISEEPISWADLEEAIWASALDFLGESGLAGTSLRPMAELWNVKTQTGVIRCAHTAVPQLVTCIGLISRLGDSRVTFKILKVSGTIRGLRA